MIKLPNRNHVTPISSTRRLAFTPESNFQAHVLVVEVAGVEPAS